MNPAISVLAEAPLPTRHGEFRTLVFASPDDPSREHVALVRGEVAGDHVLARVHSECLTGETLGSLECDCASQLDRALELIAQAERGVVVYLRRDVAHALPENARRYDAAAALLRTLGVVGLRLLTNNSDQVGALEALGVPVRERLHHVVARAEAAPAPPIRL